jgi:hypothetical protein
MSRQELADGVRVQWRVCNHAGESLTRLRSCYHRTPANLRGVGTCTECDCLLVSFGRLATSLILLTRDGLERGGHSFPGVGSLGRDGDLLILVSRPKSGSGEAKFWADPRGDFGRGGVHDSWSWGTYFKGVPRVLSTFWV